MFPRLYIHLGSFYNNNILKLSTLARLHCSLSRSQWHLAIFTLFVASGFLPRISGITRRDARWDIPWVMYILLLTPTGGNCWKVILHHLSYSTIYPNSRDLGTAHAGWTPFKKYRKNPKKLPREHLSGCQGVKLDFLVLSQLFFLSFVKIWVFEFGHHYFFLVLSQFDF